MRSPPSASTSATAPTAAPPETPNSPRIAAIPPQRAPPPTPDSQPPTPHSTPPPHSGYHAQLSGKQSRISRLSLCRFFLAREQTRQFHTPDRLKYPSIPCGPSR